MTFSVLQITVVKGKSHVLHLPDGSTIYGKLEVLVNNFRKEETYGK